MKPPFLTPDLGGIPDFLRQIPNWVLWKYVPHKKKPDKFIKLPVDAKRPDKHASTSDPTTWCDFPTCEQAYLAGHGDGVGLVNNGELGQVWIDFDKCRLDEAWALKPEIEGYLKRIEGYCEVSPSGNGLHLITKSDTNAVFKNDAMGVEVYPAGRYFTVTGIPYNGFHVEKLENQDLSWFVAELQGKKKAGVPLDNTSLKSLPTRSAGTSMLASETEGKSFWDKVNDAAMQDLGAWVPNLFYGCDITNYHGGFRVSSGELGRDLDEDISIVPEGIVDFGIADQGDARDGKRTPMDLVMEWGPHFFTDPLQVSDLKSAAFWLCEQMRVAPDKLGYGDGKPHVINFTRNKNNEILPTITNVLQALASPPHAGWVIGYDSFRDEIMLRPTDDPQGWRSWNDEDYTRMRKRLEGGGFKPIGRDLVRDCVALVAKEHLFDSAQLWLGSLPHDGRSRVESFFPYYFGTPDNDYTRAVSRYLWTALAGRVMEPGCQADMVPVLTGAQGLQKTKAIKAIAPSHEFFVEVHLDARDDNMSRKMRGKLIGEISEMRGMATREIEAIRGFITRTHEEWTPKYREFATCFPRRLAMIGTVNEEEFLVDPMGNRRWLPMRIENPIRADLISADCLQLWAEARDLWLLTGVQWAEAERLAKEVHKEFEVHDTWEDMVLDWLKTEESLQFVTFGWVRLLDVLTFGVREKGNRANELRLAKVLRGLGCSKRDVRIDANVTKAWNVAHLRATNEKKGNTK